MQSLIAAICGLLFGAGLALSGMTNPAKVLAFLDWFGSFDPTLAVVMAGALALSVPGVALARRRTRPLWALRFVWPTRRDVDFDLVAGAALFGIGWGLVGLCPGPALADLVRGSNEIFRFVGAMLGGILLHRAFASWRASGSAVVAEPSRS